MRWLKQNKWSAFSAVFVSIFLIAFINGGKLTKGDYPKVLQHDMYIYYNYLPAYFIFDDLKLGFGVNIPKEYEAEIWCSTNSDKECVLKMTMGVAILQLPFFTIAHALAEPLGYTADGYSPIYMVFLAIGVWVYSVIGLWLLRWILLRWYSDVSVAISLLAIYLGTNLFFYIVYEGNMSHSYLVFLSTVFISLLWKWNNRPLKSYAFLLGLVGGLMTLIRPIDIFIFATILFWGVSSKKDLRFRLNYLWSKRVHIGLMAVGVVVPFIPQFFYWHQVTGDWIYYSYSNEGFYFDNPVFIKALLGFRKGWLIYTPVMILAIAGLINLYKSKHEAFWPIITTLIPFTYVVVSWWCWWYGGSFGMRSMIDLYVLMAIPLAAFLDQFKDSKKKYLGVISGVVLLIGLNQFQTYQYKSGILHYDSMTAKAYFGIFGSVTYPLDYDDMIEHPDYEAASKGFR